MTVTERAATCGHRLKLNRVDLAMLLAFLLIRGRSAGVCGQTRLLVQVRVPGTSLEPSRGQACGHAHPPGQGWRLVWHDEFSGARLDRSKWNTVMDFPGRQGGHYHNTHYLSYAVDSDVVSHGTLKLLTEKRTIQGTDWLVAQDRTWPPEFDVAEWFAGEQRLHMGLATGRWPAVQWHDTNLVGHNPATGWHTYALAWSPGKAVWYEDGRVQYTVVGSYVPRKGMYIVLNSGVSSSPPNGPPNATTVFPNSFEVDYARVYAH